MLALVVAAAEQYKLARTIDRANFELLALQYEKITLG